MTSQNSAKITLAVSRIIAALVAVLIFAMPRLLGWYRMLRPLEGFAAQAILWGFYLCVPAVLYALWCMDCLVRNILKKQVFVTANVNWIRAIRWCCSWVCLVCLPAAWFYLPLVFLAVIMAFLALTVGVVKNVMAAAVELREENDLTV